MEISQEKKEKIMRTAEILMLKTELLIQTCDGWLTPEEGLKNMAKSIRERDKAERKTRLLAKFSKWARCKQNVNNFV
jgi:Flp pilus assembly protein TadB